MLGLRINGIIKYQEIPTLTVIPAQAVIPVKTGILRLQLLTDAIGTARIKIPALFALPVRFTVIPAKAGILILPVL
jgi:hypothetical protein